MNSSNLQSACKLVLLVLVLFTGAINASSQTTVAAAPVKMNVLYIGIDNPVSVAASAGSNDKVTVSIDGGGATVSKTDAGLYNVQVAAVTDECVMNVYVDGKLSGTSNFKVRRLPAPFARVGEFVSGANIPAAYFKTLGGVSTYIHDFPFEVQYQVLQFTFTITDKKGNTKSVECKDDLFSVEAKNYIVQFAGPESTVSITNIRAKDPGGRTYKLPSLVYNIK